MRKTARILFGMGGEDGKGSIVSWLAEFLGLSSIIRIGGAHGGHRVCFRGKEYIFSQFCSAAWLHARTFLSRNFLIEPIGLIKEGERLKYELGLHDAFDNLKIDPRALIITPFHGAMGRIYTLAREDKPRSSVGMGVGVTVRHVGQYPDEAIYAGDLGKTNLVEAKLEAIRVRMLREAELWMREIVSLSEQEVALAKKDFEFLASPFGVDVALDHFTKAFELGLIVDEEYLNREILLKDENPLFEISQGVLLDPRVGFHPHTTKVQVTPSAALELLSSFDYDGEVRSYMAVRSYRLCSNAGPVPTYCSELTDRVKDAGPEYFWPGKDRVGYFDEVLTRYAASAAEKVDGIFLTCVDRLPEVVGGSGELLHCSSYTGPREEKFFELTQDGRIRGIRLHDGSETDRSGRQQKLSELLFRCSPSYENVMEVPQGISMPELARQFAGIVQERLGVRIVGASIGPTNRDKIAFI